MQNTVGTPVRNKDFFPRNDIINILWEQLETGNILLVAPRRFGKTSIMYYLLDHPKTGWKPIHVDAESIREPVNFVIALIEALMADKKIRRFLVEKWKKISGFPSSFLDELSLKPYQDVEFKIKLKEQIAPSWEQIARELLCVLRVYEKSERILIIIDELPVMLYLFQDNNVAPKEIRSFLYWFRSIRTDPKVGLNNCHFLIGGSVGIDSYLSKLNAQDSFNDFERVSVLELDSTDAALFLEKLLSSRKIRLSKASQNTILKLIGIPIPYFIQVFVSEIAKARAKRKTKIGEKAIQQIYENAVLGTVCKSYFQHYYNRLSQYDKVRESASKVLLKEMALAQAPVSRDTLFSLYKRNVGNRGNKEDFIILLSELENDFYIRFLPEENAYRFGSKILCDWWRRYYAF